MASLFLLVWGEAACGVTARGPASAETGPDERTPYLLISTLLSGDQALGRQIADSLRFSI